MWAARITEPGRPPQVGETEEPRRGAGEALVEVDAFALNPVDLSVASGRFYGGSPTPPYVAGVEAVGRVVEADSLEPGSRVYLNGPGIGIARDGVWAERVAVPEAAAHAVPDAADDAIALACGVAGLAGWMPVTWRADVRSDDRVLVLGATGTVGLVALQAAKLRGAARVVAAGRRPDALRRAQQLGADAVVELDGDGLAGRFLAAFEGERPTVVIDPLWGAPAVAALEAGAPGVRLVQIGQSASAEATIPSNFVRGRQAEIYGYSNYRAPPEVFRAAYAELVGRTVAGDVVIDPIETHPLERLEEVWERQAAGPGAKLVVLAR